MNIWNFLAVVQKIGLNFYFFFELTWSKAGRTQSGFGPHLARGSPVGPGCFSPYIPDNPPRCLKCMDDPP